MEGMMRTRGSYDLQAASINAPPLPGHVEDAPVSGRCDLQAVSVNAIPRLGIRGAAVFLMGDLRVSRARGREA
jgi:hypothetical protein